MAMSFKILTSGLSPRNLWVVPVDSMAVASFDTHAPSATSVKLTFKAQ